MCCMTPFCCHSANFCMQCTLVAENKVLQILQFSDNNWGRVAPFNVVYIDSSHNYFLLKKLVNKHIEKLEIFNWSRTIVD